MLRKIALQFGFLMAAIPLMYSQSGTLVPTFGKNGISQLDFGQPGKSDDFAEIVRTDVNGKIWIAGSSSNGKNFDFSILRLDNDGTPDSTFGNNGNLLIPVGGGDDRIYGLSLDIPGKIILFGRSGLNFIVMRLNFDGTPDSTFSADGKVIITANCEQNFFSGLGTLVDKKGRMLMAGGTYVLGERNIVIVRLNPDGNPDNSFGSKGKVFIPAVDSVVGVFRAGSIVSSLAVDQDDNIIIAGNSYGQTGLPEMAIRRINNFGNIDESFGEHGKVEIFSYDGGYSNNVVIDKDGKIIIAGVYAPVGVVNFWKYAIIRLDNDGNFDNSFDNDGIAMYTAIGSGDMAENIWTDSTGQILVAGTSIVEYNDEVFSVMRMKSDGNLDSTFNGNGKAMIKMGKFDRARSLTVDNLGRILVAGSTFNVMNSNYDFGIARIKSDGELDSTFNKTGKQIMMFGRCNDEGQSIAIDNKGKIYTAGASFTADGNKLSIARVKSDGSPDTAFNGNGKITLPWETQYYPNFRSMEVNSNGKIFISGSVYNGTSHDFGIICLDNDGIPDNTFGENGMKAFSISRFDDIVAGMHQLPDGRILLYGYSFDLDPHATQNDSLGGCILRLHADGSMDSTFNHTGKRLVPGVHLIQLINSFPDGSLLIAGWEPFPGGFELVKIGPDGSYDSTLLVSISDSFIDIMSDSRNRIVILQGGGGRNYYNSVKRFNPDGSIDSTFGLNGTYFFFPSDEQYQTIAKDLFTSDNIYLTFTKEETIGIFKLKDNGVPDYSFGENGKIMVTGGLCNALKIDSNYIWLIGGGDGDYKIGKLFARNNQHITFILPDTVRSNDQLKLAATASSGLPVAYTSSNPAIAFISHDTLIITGTGTVSIRAKQDGDGSFYAAEPVTVHLLITGEVTGIPDQDLQQKINIYPNPVSGKLFLESSVNIQSVTLTGVDGNLLYEKTNISSNIFNIDMSNFKPGCYILTIQSGDESPRIVKKILKY